MTVDANMVLFSRADGESPGQFGDRVRAIAKELGTRPEASTVVAYVADGDVAAPTTMVNRWDYEAALLVAGVAVGDLPESEAVYGVQRRVIKCRERGRNGARSPGFTLVCPVARAGHLDHEQFNAYWRDVHSRVHVESSPGTRHYEQLIIEEWPTPSAVRWDGVGLLSFGSIEDYTERMFGPGGQEAIYTDVKNFLSQDGNHTLPSTEYVYRDASVGVWNGGRRWPDPPEIVDAAELRDRTA